MAVQGPASGQVANVGQLLSLLQDQKLLPPTETANPLQLILTKVKILMVLNLQTLNQLLRKSFPKPRAVDSFRLRWGYDIWICLSQQRATSRS